MTKRDEAASKLREMMYGRGSVTGAIDAAVDAIVAAAVEAVEARIASADGLGNFVAGCVRVAEAAKEPDVPRRHCMSESPSPPPQPSCVWARENDDGIASDPPCGKPATHISCVPNNISPTCAAHKCRCAKPIGSPDGLCRERLGHIACRHEHGHSGQHENYSGASWPNVGPPKSLRTTGDSPKRVWACLEKDYSHVSGAPFQDPHGITTSEYVRADIHDAEVARLNEKIEYDSGCLCGSGTAWCPVHNPP